MRPLPTLLFSLITLTSRVHSKHGNPSLHGAALKEPGYESALPTANSHARRVAVVGAGAAGSSAAYHLFRSAHSAGADVAITVYEREPRAGGRSTTVRPWGLPDAPPVELGASIFVAVNYVLMNATAALGLTLQPASAQTPTGFKGPGLGVWDGERFAFLQRATPDGQGLVGWWDLVRLIWRYGMAPYRAKKLVDEVIGQFLGMYEKGVLPFADLTEAADELELLEVSGLTGEQFLRNRAIDDLFAREIVQASVNYAQNLGVINGLETMVSMAPEGAVSVEGGNWQIFAGMVNASTSDVRFETAVDTITSLKNRTFKVTARDVKSNKTTDSWFDEVIVATPYQFSNLTISPELASTPEEIPYVTLHVTLFSSPHLLSPAAFNLNPGDAVPLVVLTTLDPTEEPGTKTPYAGKAGFFSISLLQPVVNPATNEEEYLYKIFSPAAITPEFLASILGVEDVPKDINSFDKADVSWMYLKVWKSYPVEYPRVTFDHIELAPGLYYTGGMDSFISCMETNALMGMNVARLIVDKWTREEMRPAQQQFHHEEQFQAAGQKILNGA